MGSLALATLFRGAAIQLGHALEECQMLERLALSYVGAEEIIALQAFDSLTQTIEQFALLFQRLAMQEDIQDVIMTTNAVDRMTLVVLREALSGCNQTSPQNTGGVDFF